MWAEQIRLADEAKRAHTAMTDQQQPHYYARLKASENKGIGGAPPASQKTQADGENDLVDRRKPYAQAEDLTRQDWHNMDMSGQGLRNLAPELFRYTFLNELYIASNKLTRLPKQIGELRQLRHLDASYNQITELPAELGMCTYLKQLLLFNNNIHALPTELGSLHMLDMLGIEGNPLLGEVKQEIMEKGTKSLINYLKETASRKYYFYIDMKDTEIGLTHNVQPHRSRLLARILWFRKTFPRAWRGSRSFHGIFSVTSMRLNRHMATHHHKLSLGLIAKTRFWRNSTTRMPISLRCKRFQLKLSRKT
jgi:hypothetical protein